MRILIYKRTHNGDPDSNGCFGIHDCMGMVRYRAFDAVIGIGGIGSEAQAKGIAGKVNWIGIGPRKTIVGKRGPEVTFDHFVDFGTAGPVFRDLAPNLADWMYSRNVRHLMDSLRGQKYAEASALVRMAEHAPPSRGRASTHKRVRHCRRRGCGHTRRSSC